MKPETAEWLDKAEGDWKVAQREMQAPEGYEVAAPGGAGAVMGQNDTLAAVFAAPRPARLVGGNTTGPGRVHERNPQQDV